MLKKRSYSKKGFACTSKPTSRQFNFSEYMGIKLMLSLTKFPIGSKYFACYEGYDVVRSELRSFMLHSEERGKHEYASIVTLEQVIERSRMPERTIKALQNCRVGTYVRVGSGSAKYSTKWLRRLSEDEVAELRKRVDAVRRATSKKTEVWDKIRATCGDLLEKHSKIGVLIQELELDCEDAAHKILGTPKAPHRPKRRKDLEWDLLN